MATNSAMSIDVSGSLTGIAELLDGTGRYYLPEVSTAKAGIIFYPFPDNTFLFYAKQLTYEPHAKIRTHFCDYDYASQCGRKQNLQ
ncbi:hypothetical protein M0802_013032 [Mischocyttarus mexicanus]|nr:hypothetical protein M0802_013032 [Mischocyttarus mexicanus]